MARWRCNAPNPGSYLQGRGIVYPVRSSATPDEPEDPFFERAREMWVPLDSGAEKLVAQAKKDVEKMNKENGRRPRRSASGSRKEGAAAVFAREFKTREDQGPGVSRSSGSAASSSRTRTSRRATMPGPSKSRRSEEGRRLRREAGGAGDRARASGARWRCRRAARRDPNDLTAPEKDAKGSKGSKK
jgi:hypothetical protein